MQKRKYSATKGLMERRIRDKQYVRPELYEAICKKARKENDGENENSKLV